MGLFKDFPTPWKAEGENIEASNGNIIYCDVQYYPFSDLSKENWLELIELVNNIKSNGISNNTVDNGREQSNNPRNN